MLLHYLAKQTLILVSMRIFLDHATKQISICIPMAEMFIYLFTAMLRDVTISLLRHYCVCPISFRLSRSCQFFEAH